MKPGPAIVLLLLALGGCVARPPLVPATPLEERETTEVLALLAAWKPPPIAETCTGIRPEPGGALSAWPREHAWLASGVAARSPLATPLLLVLRDARTRAPLIGGELRPGLHGAFVLLLRVPALDRAVLLCYCDERWQVAARADIPALALGKGFDAYPLPELRTGGWLERDVERVPALREDGENLHSANLWLWSGNGRGTETIAGWKDAKLRGEPPAGSSLVAEPTNLDPWFLQNPLADWPWPVWTLTAEVRPSPVPPR